VAIRKEKKKNDPVCVNIRWMIRRDMPEVMEVEQGSFEFSWGEDDFVRCLRQRNSIGMVAEYNERVVGFMIYELHKTRLHILNFAVRPDMRHRSVGTQMIKKLSNGLSNQRRNRIVVEVRETNLPAQLFFRALKFRAITVLREFYRDPNDSTDNDTEGAYLMQLNYAPKREFVYVPAQKNKPPKT